MINLRETFHEQQNLLKKDLKDQLALAGKVLENLKNYFDKQYDKFKSDLLGKIY